MKLREFLKKEIGTIQIDWDKVEEHIGFTIHKDLKNFYSRDAGKDIKDVVDFVEEKFMEIIFRHIETPAHITRDVIVIDSMAVDEKYRGMGIGHLFFEKVKRIKEQKHCDGIELVVNSKNKAAYEMYSKCGFTVKSINMELL